MVTVSTLPYSSLEPYLRVLPSIIVLGYEFCYPWIPRAVLEEPSSQRRNKKSLKVGDGPETRQSSTCCRDFGTKERESEGREVVLGTLFILLVKDKLLYSGKVPVNVELRPLRREKRGKKVQRYGTLNEAMKM